MSDAKPQAIGRHFRRLEAAVIIWPVLTALFIALCAVIWWVHDVSAYGMTLENHEQRIKKVEETFTDVQVVKQRVEDMATFMGVPKDYGKRGNRQ